MAAEMLPYLKAMGIECLYCSPVFESASGSTHGYDVTHPSKISSERGDKQGWRRLENAARREKIAIMLDVVPNHMAADSRENLWWQDVLALGTKSRFANFFDIDWDSPLCIIDGQLLLPILGRFSRDAVARDELVVALEGSWLFLKYFDQRFPLRPRSVASLLESAGAPEAVRNIAASLARYDEQGVSGINRSLLDELENTGWGESLHTAGAESLLRTAIERCNADKDRLQQLVNEQHYRLVFWQVAECVTGYRRFFHLNGLVALRTELEPVFEAVHEQVLDLHCNGSLVALRVDHPDGLADPKGYLERLNEKAPGSSVYVEKILEIDEELPADWRVEGTTGYDALTLLTQLLVNAEAEPAFSEIYRNLTGQHRSYEAVAHEKKIEVARQLFSGDLFRLTRILDDICLTEPELSRCHWLDMQDALVQIAAAFPVYRSYVRPGSSESSPEDRARTLQAIQRAKGAASGPPALFALLERILLGSTRSRKEDELLIRFQQFTGPLAAKGVEDTAFFTYNRLLALNEVGGNPGRFGVALDDFHRWCVRRLDCFPADISASSTHDTKRSEDVRARLCVLTEIPEEWRRAVTGWVSVNERHWQGRVPDRNIEYYLYQTLVGAWPISEDRVLAHVLKAVKEAKEHTDWSHPNGDYESGLEAFVKGILGDEQFLGELGSFVNRVQHAGYVKSLTQTLLKLAMPGVPDLYQGCELWDFSLVDPDNRRPVDFPVRRAILDFVKSASAEEITARMTDGAPKLHLINRVLEARLRAPEVFLHGEYRPLYAGGSARDSIVAFMRGERVVAVAPRLTLAAPAGWRDDAVAIPEGRWENLLTGEAISGGHHSLGALFQAFPVAFLFR